MKTKYFYILFLSSFLLYLIYLIYTIYFKNYKKMDKILIKKYSNIKKNQTIPLNNIISTAYKYQHGNENITRSYNKAEELYKIAAQRGSNESIIYLANLYHDGGTNIKPNIKKALYYYTLALKNGYYDCLLDIGNIYLWGFN